jgi:uncharacterized membrane protein
MKSFCAVILAVVAMSCLAPAATIHGASYDYNLDVLKGTVLKVNTTPEQSIVMPDGEYSIELPVGGYSLKAGYYVNGRLAMSDEQNVTVVDNGDYVIDFILLPEFDFNESIFGDEEGIGDIDAGESEEAGEGDYTLVIIALLGIIAILAVIYIIRGKPAEAAAKGAAPEIPEDLQQAIDIIGESGGRMNQKDLRNRLPYSEAKVSLMVSDLESRGIVKRFKKGRGNIIRLEKA